MVGAGAKMDWNEAVASGRAMLEGVERIRLPGAESGVELAGLDWGGEGELVVMHHANGFCAATLAPLAVMLRDRFRVVALDARGHGDSTPVKPGPANEGYDWETLALDSERAIAGVLGKTGHDRVALAIGHSFGGALLLRVAERVGPQIERLLLCDPVLLPPLTPEQIAVPSNGSGLAAATRKRRNVFPSLEAAYEHCRTRGLFADFTPEALALYISEGMAEDQAGEATLKCDREIEAAIFDGGAFAAVAEEVGEATAQVLFVHAERGNFIRAYYEEVAGRMPNASVTGGDFGHLFPLESPATAVEFVDSMFEK